MDDEITPEEREEAEALSRALERQRADAALPEDALEVAALLRYARDGGELDPERAEAILGDVFQEARIPERKKGLLFRLRWPLMALGAAAATVAVWVTLSAESGTVAALPAPPSDLLKAQVTAASGRTDLADLERQMRTYRVSVYDALEGRYER